MGDFFVFLVQSLVSFFAIDSVVFVIIFLLSFFLVGFLVMLIKRSICRYD